MPVPHPADRESAHAADTIAVRSGSRLHFGLFSFGRSGGHQYGGVGLMVESPGVCLRIRRASGFQIAGMHSDRVAQAAEHWRRAFGEAALPRCLVELVTAPPQHIGLGSGTQLACAVAAGLSAWKGSAITCPAQLARASGRASRSAIGTHGFLRGGLIVDDGKCDSEGVGRLAARLAFPTDWPVVLLWPRQMESHTVMCGPSESDAFRGMPPVSLEREAELRRLATEELVPAVEARRFEQFGNALYRYNRLAGECYRTLQGSAYATDSVGRLIEQLRDSGAAAVGQSSWGPLVFAIMPSAASAFAVQETVKTSEWGRGFHCQITRAANRAARVERQGHARGDEPDRPAVSYRADHFQP